MLNKYWCLLLLSALLVNPLAAETKQTNTEKKKIPLSMFIPGLYQLTHQRYAEGSILLCSFIGTCTGAAIFNHKGNKTYDQYLKEINVPEIVRLRQETEKNFRRRNLFIAGIFTTWLLHIMDIKFIKKNKGGIKSSIGRNWIHVGFYYQF